MGFWSNLGSPAAVDWCEPNYLYTPYIAEWWNTLSSLVIAALPAWGAVLWAQAPRREGRFFWGYLSLVVVGLGSTAFHATLLKVPQASDELPMLYCGLAYAYVLLRRHSRPGAADDERRGASWRWAFALYGVALSVTYVLLKDYFVFFLGAYGVIVAYLSLGTIYIAWKEDPRPVIRRLLAASTGCYLFGFFGLWIPEHVLLPCAHPLQALQLHAWFHVTSAVGSYAWLQLMAVHRARVLGEDVAWRGLVPFAETRAVLG